MAEQTKMAGEDARAAAVQQRAKGVMTQEEREARWKELRQRMSVSRIYVKAPQGITVRWARKDDANDMSYHEWMGFVIVREDPTIVKEKRRFQTAVPVREDGTYIVGDVILMEIDTETYEFYIRERLQQANAVPQAAKKEFREQAEALKAPTFERDRSGSILR